MGCTVLLPFSPFGESRAGSRTCGPGMGREHDSGVRHTNLVTSNGRDEGISDQTTRLGGVLHVHTGGYSLGCIWSELN